MRKDIKNYELVEKLSNDFLYDFVCLRHKLGMTQDQMAKKSGVLRDKVTKIEIGMYTPNITSLFEILGPLGYTIKICKIKEKNDNE